MIVHKGIGADSRLSLLIAQAVLVMILAGTSIAEQEPVTCDPKTGVLDFGLEWIADECVPKDMTDNTMVHYTNTFVSCDRSNKTVRLFAHYGDDTMAPVDFISYALGITASDGRHYKIFRNSQGTHLLLVHPGFTGEIDGKSMTDYAEGEVHTDVFDRGFILPPTPICKKDYNQCKLEAAASSTVNIGSGRLSHSQELFSTKGGRSPLAITINYRSIPFAPSSIGSGWSHSYETSLQIGSNGAVTLWDDGKARDYSVVGGTLKASPGDYSILVKNGDGSYLLTEKDGLARNFDAVGRLTSFSDRNGNTSSFTYAGGKLSSVVDPNGRSATFTYDANGNLATIVDPLDNSYNFTYTSGTLSRITHPDGGTWDYTYAGNSMLETKTDQVGNTSSYAYDADQRVTGATDPQGQSRSFGSGGGGAAGGVGKVPQPYPRCKSFIDPDSKLITQVGNCENVNVPITEKNNGGWQYTYEYTSETLESKTDPYNNTTSYTHDKDGNVLTVTEPGIGTTQYTYDANGNATSTKDPLGNTTIHTYNSFGQILATSGPQGDTSNIYDFKGNLTSSTDVAGATTTYEYDSKGNVTKITNAKSQAVIMTYTAAGQLESGTDLAGIVTSYSYDAGGNMLTSTDPSGSTTYAYDSMNRLTGITDAQGNVSSYAYDKQGNRISQTDANGNTTTYAYNYLGQIVEAKDALDNKTTFDYGASACPSCSSGVDKLTALTDAKQQTTSYEYDLVSRLTKETDPLSKATSYTYDAAGNLAGKTDANGVTVNYAYDALKRLTGKSYPDNSSETYTYDAAGRIASAANKEVSYTYIYDTAGRLANVADSRGFAIAYEHDILGSRTKTTLQPGTADQRVTTYTYDTANRPKTITTNAGAFTYDYDTLGRRSSTAYPNGISATYKYDTLSRLTSVSHAAGGATIAFANYSGFDNVGNRKDKTFDCGTETYSYDPVYRLTKATTPNGTENYSYDAVGNRLTGPGPKDTKYKYNADNQMIIGRILSYVYDNSGNQTTRTSPKTPDKGWDASWDYENQLVKMEKGKGAEKRTVSFKYDPLGRRIEKKLMTIIGGVTKTSTWTYVYDSDDIALEIYTDANGTVTKTFYTHGVDVDEHLALEGNGNNHYYHADGLGSITAITDVNKDVVQSYEYDSFGMIKPSTAFRNNYIYTGREWDKETGLYYYRARYYDPMEGRFISKDPISFSGGDVNLYGYVQNNPLNFNDPFGLWRTHPRYGNWGGEGWSGGNSGKEAPIDSLDMCYKEHDLCYEDFKGDACKSKKVCDKQLAACVYSLPANSSDWARRPPNPIYASFYRTWALTYFQTQY